MKTLFLKSNLLHIRTNEGEFEVSNPEGALSLLSLGSKKDLYDGKNIEWPHGVERVSDCSCQVNKTRCWGPCGADTTVKIRLIPEEKKAESAYREFDKPEPCAYEEECQHPACNCGKMIEPFNKECPKCRTKDFASCHSMHCPVRKPVSAPSESQEEMYNEVRQEYLKHRGRIWTKEEVMLKWIIENYKLITRKPE